MAYSFIKNLLVTFVALVVLCVMINYIVDPVAIYNGPVFKRFNLKKSQIQFYEPMFKLHLASSENWNVIFLGTSRTNIGLNPKSLMEGSNKVVNLATASQSYENSLVLFKTALKHSRHNLKTVVLGLDFFPANVFDRAPGNWPREGITGFGYFESLLSLSMLSASIDTLKSNLVNKDFKDCSGNGIYYDLKVGNQCTYPLLDGQRSATVKGETAYAQNVYLPGPFFKFALKSGNKSPLDNIRQLIQLANKNDVDVILFIQPLHARQLEIIDAIGLWDVFEEWKRQLA